MRVIRLLSLFTLLALAPPAQAYLDPSTGSLILSAIVGLLATIGLAVKTWWYRIKSLFRRHPAAMEGDATKSRRD
jgi:hypothetical protein